MPQSLHGNPHKLTDQCGRWLPQLVENVQKHAQTVFYRNLATMTDKYAQNDIETLARRANLGSRVNER